MKNLVLLFLIVYMVSQAALAQYNPLLEYSHPNYTHTLGYQSSFSSEEEFYLKNENTAVILTLVAPMVSISSGIMLIKYEHNFLGSLLVIGGVIIGPSAGNYYAENSESVMKGISTRLLGGGMFTVGSYLSVIEAIGRSFNGEKNEVIAIGGAALIVGGAGLILYSFIFDLFNSAESVKKYNEALGHKSFSVSPTYFPKENTPGISLSLRF